MNRSSLYERLEQNGNHCGELCRLDRELRRRPPTSEEIEFLGDAAAGAYDDTLGGIGHGERVLNAVADRWDIDTEERF